MRIHNVVALIVGSALMNVAVAACYSHKGGGGTSSAFADGSGGGGSGALPTVVDMPCNYDTNLQAVATFADASQAELMSVMAFMYSTDAPTKRTQLLTALDGQTVTVQGDCGSLVGTATPGSVRISFMKP